MAHRPTNHTNASQQGWYVGGIVPSDAGAGSMPASGTRLAGAAPASQVSRFDERLTCDSYYLRVIMKDR